MIRRFLVTSPHVSRQIVEEYGCKKAEEKSVENLKMPFSNNTKFLFFHIPYQIPMVCMAKILFPHESPTPTLTPSPSHPPSLSKNKNKGVTYL
jgi:hypothetical protein